MDYLYARVRDCHFSLSTPLRKTFRTHLENVAKALRSIEWNDSGDGDDDEEENIRACLSKTEELEFAIAEANDAMANLKRAIGNAKSMLNKPTKGELK